MDKIRLDEQYSIEYDVFNWILRQEIKGGKISPKTKKPITTRRESFYPSIKMLLKHYLDATLKGSKDIEEILSRISEVERTIDRVCLQKLENKTGEDIWEK